MADSLFFLMTFFGVTWLCIWVFRSGRAGKPRWAPFDMVERGPQTRPVETKPAGWTRKLP